ncbi:hypothetical protein FB645_003685 [Coemansia sp. IMI 203386]|nr:hypothetical protein FB645_003685 [Coemansia sp. IMI 203386]
MFLLSPLFATITFCIITLHASVVKPDPVIFGYLPTWQLDNIDNLDLTKYTHLSVSFAVPDSQAQLTLSNSDLAFSALPSDTNQKRLVSLGGWSGSKHLSEIFNNPEKRLKLQQQMIQWMHKYQLDGWDIDYEYPGRQGAVCHKFDATKDTDNFLTFLNELRDQMDGEFPVEKEDGRKLITLAARFQPFDGPQGPLTDVSAFAQPVDLINLMLYDFNGIWSQTTGANAPLEAAPEHSPGSFKSSITQWMDAGIPADKLVAGVAFYGRTVTATSNMAENGSMHAKLLKEKIPQGDTDDREEPDPSCGGPAVFSGIWKYRNIRQDILPDAEQPLDPWVRFFDKDSQTPWLFNKETKDFVSYDDTQSIATKVGYAKDQGLAGIMVWTVTNDYENELLNTIYDTLQ